MIPKDLQDAVAIIRNGEGFGSLYQSIMSGFAFCRFSNKKFVYIPVQHVGHGVSSTHFNKFTGFKSDTILDKSLIKLHKRQYIAEVHKAPRPSKYYTEDVREELRKMYYTNSKPESCPYDIAIHIRRGDVTGGGRFTENNYYKSFLIPFMKKKYPDYSICIYSEGKIEDFEDLKILGNINFILNGNPLVSYHHLVTAKILVTAVSSYSYTAGILSKGKVYYIKFGEKPMDDWTILDDYKSAEIT